jgi:hypothetical protein
MSAVLKQGIWTPEKRLEQSCALLARKIWLKSTGPRTPQGKLKSSMNARKEGYEDRQRDKRVKNYVRLNRMFLNIYMSQRPLWHVLKSQERASFIRQLGVLENELSILASEILFDTTIPSKIIPFPRTPPTCLSIFVIKIKK